MSTLFVQTLTVRLFSTTISIAQVSSKILEPRLLAPLASAMVVSAGLSRPRALQTGYGLTCEAHILIRFQVWLGRLLLQRAADSKSQFVPLEDDDLAHPQPSLMIRDDAANKAVAYDHYLRVTRERRAQN